MDISAFISQIFRTLKKMCTIMDANLNNDYEELPTSFHLSGVDHWLEKFTAEVSIFVRSLM